jgi:hypothetical protein
MARWGMITTRLYQTFAATRLPNIICNVFSFSTKIEAKEAHRSKDLQQNLISFYRALSFKVFASLTSPVLLFASGGRFLHSPNLETDLVYGFCVSFRASSEI